MCWLITRIRKTVVNTEKSVIVCRVSMQIDEDRVFTLSKFSGKTGNKDFKESDQNQLELIMNISWLTTKQAKFTYLLPQL